MRTCLNRSAFPYASAVCLNTSSVALDGYLVDSRAESLPFKHINVFYSIINEGHTEDTRPRRIVKNTTQLDTMDRSIHRQSTSKTEMDDYN